MFKKIRWRFLRNKTYNGNMLYGIFLNEKLKRGNNIFHSRRFLQKSIRTIRFAMKKIVVGIVKISNQVSAACAFYKNKYTKLDRLWTSHLFWKIRKEVTKTPPPQRVLLPYPQTNKTFRKKCFQGLSKGCFENKSRYSLKGPLLEHA